MAPPERIEPQWWHDNLPRVRAFVHRRLRPELAQLEAPSDIVQSACRELLADIERESAVRGGIQVLRFRFLRRALRKIVQKHRYHAARRRSPQRLQGSADSAADPATGPIGRMLQSERAELLAKAMQELPEKQQRIIEWVHFEGLPHVEVARRLGCTEAASKMRLSRAMAELARLLDAG